jgi:hypothetical protein
MKFKMAATAGLSLTLGPMGNMLQNASSMKPLGQLKPNCPAIRCAGFTYRLDRLKPRPSKFRGVPAKVYNIFNNVI